MSDLALANAPAPLVAADAPPDPIRIDPVGSAMLLRTARDPAEPLTTMTRRLPTEDRRGLVVSAPSVSARPDYFALVADLLDTWPPDHDHGVRLVALGPAREPPAVESALRELADRTGREVVGPLGTVTVAVDGTLAVAAPPGAPGGWVTYAPGLPPRYHAAWFPLPDWAAGLPAKTAAVCDIGTAAVHPVPAGFWILPAGIRPGSAGPAACLPPGASPSVFIGGYGRDPLPVGALKQALRRLRHVADARLVLLPGALPDSSAYATLRRAYRRGRITVGVPVWSPERQWELSTVDAFGRLTWQPPARERVPDHRTFSRGSDASAVRKLQGADLIGARTPAGWSFLHTATPIGVVPAVAGFLVEVETAAAGFLLDGQPVSPASLAERIAHTADLGRTPLVVVGHGAPPADPDAGYGAVSQQLGVPVTAAAADVAISPTGILYTAGRFRTWRPAAGHPQSRVLGGILPPLPDTPATRPQRIDPPAAEPPPIDSPVAEPDRSTPALGPAGGTRLRDLLGGQYEVYEQTVSQAIADEAELYPDAPDVADLVAVRAYSAAERTAVNQALRGTTEGVDAIRAKALADRVTAGLRHLPVVFGPVFATTGAAVQPPAYRVGDEVLEPAFVDVDLFPGNASGPGVSYVIWSATARRLGRLAAGPRGTAVFPAGTRFRVLGVTRAGGRLRVLLLDLALAEAASTATALRAAADRLATANLPASGLLGSPIGGDTAGLSSPPGIR